MQGDVVHVEFKTVKDPDTGVLVTRLSDDQGDTNHPYFTVSQVDREVTYLIVTSNRTGRDQFYALDLADGRMVQLTDDGDVHTGCLDAENHVLYYFAGHLLKSVRLDNLAETELMSMPSGFIPASLSCTADGSALAWTIVELADVDLCTARFEAEFSGGSKGFREKFYRYPSSLILRYDTAANSGYVVTGEHRRMTHVIIHPEDANTVLFCHEGPWHLVQRMWIAKVATDEVYPLIETQRHLERVGHEFFTQDGRVGAQYSYRYRSDMNWLFHADVYVDPDGSHEQRYYYPYTRPVHVHANAEDQVAVGDTAHIRGDDPDARRYISLIKYDPAGHRAIVGRLCRHDTSWRKASHPHPIITPDNRRVIWGSDLGGRMNVYMAEVDWEACLKSDR
jgi:oligogalacturonide lyase